MEEITTKYNFIKPIGKGSFSQIYLIEDIKKGKKYALKHITKKTYQNSQECQILNLLQKHPHKNLIGLKEIIETEKDIFIVLELIENGTLYNYLNTVGPLPEKKLRKLFSGILDGLQHMHEKLGVVHRDLKIENILVSDHEEPKLIDFNLSFFWNTTELQTKYCGTVVYCAPEIVSGIPYTGPPQDVWSLGVVLFYMIFNRFPFSSEKKDKKEKRKSLMKRIAACDYQFPNDKKVSNEVLNLLTAMLQMDPSKRPSINEIRKHPWFKLELKDNFFVEGEGDEIFAVVGWNENADGAHDHEEEIKKEKKTKGSTIGTLKRSVISKFRSLKTH